MNYRFFIAIIILVSGLTWSASLTDEFTGYDDIKLITRNQSEPFPTMVPYDLNLLSESNSLAWSNQPSAIYRPMELIMLSIGHKIWGSNPWYFHFFYNLLFHLLNSLLIFFILYKLLEGFYTREKSQQLSFIITLIWTVHPLHNEAINMLSSGPGFLLSKLLSLSAICIWLYKDSKLSNIPASILLLLACFGSEMALVTPLIFLVLKGAKLLRKNAHTILKLFSSIAACLVYLVIRPSGSALQNFFSADFISEFIERKYILAPQVFFHYIKLFFYPANLTIDQHHNVVLSEAFSLYHLLCLIIFIAFGLIPIFYFINFVNKRDQDNDNNHLAVVSSMFLAFVSLLPMLNIIPIYTLARERYSYLFCLAMIAAIVIAIEHLHLKKPVLIALVIISCAVFSVRSNLRCLDWKNGEKLWTSTVDSVNDIGAKQIWRYRLLSYYADPVNHGFDIDLDLYDTTLARFANFVDENNLLEGVYQGNKLEEKYQYSGAKSIGSALFLSSNLNAVLDPESKVSLPLMLLAHKYYPEHFLNNLELFSQAYINDEQEISSDFLSKLLPATENNFTNARKLMIKLLVLRHNASLKMAKKFHEQYPDSLDFLSYLFEAALRAGDNELALTTAQRIKKKNWKENTKALEFLEGNG